MFLIDTNVISEARKGGRANAGVRRFFEQVAEENVSVFLSVVTLGELRRGVELIRHRGDTRQAGQLSRWLNQVVERYGDYVLPLDGEAAQIWGKLRVPRPEHALDKQIAATALLHDLTVVTRNGPDFVRTGVRTVDPFV